MGNKNYSKYSEHSKPKGTFYEPSHEHTKDIVEEVTDEPIVENVENVENTDESVETQPIIGVVTGCEKLYVREKADKQSDHLCIIDVNSEVNIISETEDFYMVVTPSGVEGYCMKKFITIIVK